ncbi:Ribonuclease P protein component [Alteracholeplasma palmae J233]|uniref:Ribonuclease P protein component n=1 Tax=Alteracholeplasma palmae (strain ATCC 49389 / J233) TaxID=1318466 RepID=U4KM04_ALTPJ|nr:ribonuclease P protein component [Alteracholeplasma palmae]CCV65017.1 Ribonuclease P protein component [Alteracholeplasma palmae J233]
MKRKHSIKKTSEIDAVFKIKKSVGNPYFVIYKKKDNGYDYFRYALSIGKKYGKAHERNLIKRRIRMIVSETASTIDLKTDFIIVIKPKASELEYNQIKVNILALMSKAQITSQERN